MPFEQEKHVVRRRCLKASPHVVMETQAMLLQPNPANQLRILIKLGVSLKLKIMLSNIPSNFDLEKKPKVHQLTNAQIDKIRKRSVLQYLKFNEGKWK